jgi:hypothetical protein
MILLGECQTRPDSYTPSRYIPTPPFHATCVSPLLRKRRSAGGDHTGVHNPHSDAPRARLKAPTPSSPELLHLASVLTYAPILTRCASCCACCTQRDVLFAPRALLFALCSPLFLGLTLPGRTDRRHTPEGLLFKEGFSACGTLTPQYLYPYSFPVGTQRNDVERSTIRVGAGATGRLDRYAVSCRVDVDQCMGHGS